MPQGNTKSQVNELLDLYSTGQVYHHSSSFLKQPWFISCNFGNFFKMAGLPQNGSKDFLVFCVRDWFKEDLIKIQLIRVFLKPI